MLTIFVASLYNHVRRSFSPVPVAHGLSKADVLADVQATLATYAKEYDLSVGPTHVVVDEGLDGADVYLRCGTRALVTVHVNSIDVDVDLPTAPVVEPAPVAPAVQEAPQEQEPPTSEQLEDDAQQSE